MLFLIRHQSRTSVSVRRVLSDSAHRLTPLVGLGVYEHVQSFQVMIKLTRSQIMTNDGMATCNSPTGCLLSLAHYLESLSRRTTDTFTVLSVYWSVCGCVNDRE